MTQKGEAFDGKKFTPYSKRNLPAFFFVGKSRAGYADKEVKQIAKKGGALSYAKFRAINRLTNTQKDFSFTGKMWESYKVLKSDSGNGKFSVLIGVGGKDEFKAEYGSAREKKNILKPSKSEVKIANDTVTFEVKKIIKKHLE